LVAPFFCGLMRFLLSPPANSTFIAKTGESFYRVRLQF
jgi:hypothetical protein